MLHIELQEYTKYLCCILMMSKTLGDIQKNQIILAANASQDIFLSLN